MTYQEAVDNTDAEATPGAAGPRPGSWRGLQLLHRHRVLAYTLVVVALLTQMAVGMVTSARQESTTVDEPVYIGAAVVYMQQHSLGYNFEHPPLAKLLMATGLAFGDARIDPRVIDQSHEWNLGNDVLYAEGNGAQRMLLLARLPMIVLTMVFGLVVFGFARDLVGPVGGLVALGLYAFSPDVIAYGSLAGVDMPMVGFLLTTLWLLWRARQRPGLYLPLAGLALGAALAAKMTALPAVPVVALLAVLSVWHAPRAAHARPNRLRLLLAGCSAAVGMVVISIATVWATYLAVDPHLRWTTPPNLPAVHGLTGRLVDWLPFPRPFRDGVKVQLGFEHDQFGSFLLGHTYPGGTWYYLPAALLVKEPLGMLALWALAAVVMLATSRLRTAALYLLAPTLFLLLVAMRGSRDLGVRYAIFVPVFMAVAAGCVVAYRIRWIHVAAGLLLVFVAMSSLRTFPLYLPYSNEAFGGPSKTYMRLNDSNVDWGQDMARLGALVRLDYPDQPVWLDYKGRGSSRYYGITARDASKVPASQVHGLIAVSSTRLPWLSGSWKTVVDSSTRIGDVGHSIILYRR